MSTVFHINLWSRLEFYVNQSVFKAILFSFEVKFGVAYIYLLNKNMFFVC